jgi:hypothetical protein
MLNNADRAVCTQENVISSKEKDSATGDKQVQEE